MYEPGRFDSELSPLFVSILSHLINNIIILETHDLIALYKADTPYESSLPMGSKLLPKQCMGYQPFVTFTGPRNTPD